jgi:hypothetical protein
MRRLYFLLPDRGSCQAVIEILKGDGVAESQMHVVASLDTPLDGLPEATVWQKTELAHGIEIGLGLGGVAGLLGGVFAVTFPPAGLVLGGGALLGGALAGAGFGAVISALMKGHEHNHKLHGFQREIEEGKILLMIDIPRLRVDEIQQLILDQQPELQIEVAKPTG